MIVRNESHVIHELIESVAPYIDYWVIVDTGSTDGTQEIVHRLMQKRGIPGELHERPWSNFGANRSEALALAQGHADYIWVMDADDLIVGAPDFSDLHADGYSMRIRDGQMYWRLQLFRDGIPWRYVGVLHEVAECTTPHTRQRLEGAYHIESRRLGDRSKESSKYARDAAILQTEVDRHPDESRTVFYLAMSYFWAGDFANARLWFERRAVMGGWDEEVYLSLLRTASAMESLQQPWPEVQQAYLTAWAYRPVRAEALYAIARHYRVDGQYQLGYLFAQLAAETPLPLDDTLFVQEDVYQWRALDEQAVCASWIGKSPEAFAICRRLLSQPNIPDDDRRRIAANRDLAVPEMLGIASARMEGVAIPSEASADVTVTLLAGPDLSATEASIDTFMNCCLDRHLLSRFIVFYADLSDADRTALRDRYDFLEFIRIPVAADSVSQLDALRGHVSARYWLHVPRAWRFFAPESLITRMLAVMEAEPAVVQFGVNLGDSPVLTGLCPPEGEVRRTPDGQRYVMAHERISGPAMVDIVRFDSLVDAESAFEAPGHIATCDEVLCLAPE